MIVRRWVIGAAASTLLLTGACGKAEDASPPSSAPTTLLPGTATTAQVVGDGTPFCNAMIGLGQIQMGASSAEVQAANQQLVALLDEAQAGSPEDAPPDLDALIDDYRTASDAISAAGGDLDAAYAAMPPEVVARLGADDSHPEAYAFLVARCGLTAP